MKLYPFILCLFLSALANGQKHSISIYYKPSLTYFGKQTQSFNTIDFTSRNGNQTFNNSVDILYGYKLTSQLSLATGLEYAQQGQNIKLNVNRNFPISTRILKIELDYLRVPFIVNYSMVQMDKSELGIYSGISFGAEIKRKDNYQDILFEDILIPKAEKRYKTQDWAIPLGINYRKEITPNVFANFGAEYLIGLTNAFTENENYKYGVLSWFDNSRQSRLALNIGISFNLTK